MDAKQYFLENRSPVEFSFSIPVKQPDGTFTEMEKKGQILLQSVSSQSCEVDATLNGWFFELIVGRYTSGHYVCIPNWHQGAPLSRLADELWNYESLRKAGFDQANAQGLAAALYCLSEYVDL